MTEGHRALLAQPIALRNRLAHDYPDDPAKQAEIINRAWSAVPTAKSMLTALLAFVARECLA